MKGFYNAKKIMLPLLITICLLLTSLAVGQVIPKNQNNEPFGIMNFAPTQHDFGAVFKGHAAQTTFEIWMTGGCCSVTYNIQWTASWINVFPTSGTTTGEKDPITVTIDTTNLELGYYTETIDIISDGGNGQFTLSVNVIKTPDATLYFEPESYDFGDKFVDKQYETTFDIWNSGTEPLNYSITANQPWVTITPETGVSTGERDTITVSIDLEDVPLGTHTDQLMIDTNNNSGTFDIAVNVVPIPQLSFNAFKTGVLSLKNTIHNPGDIDAPNIEWTIKLEGGTIFFGQENSGTITNLAAGESQSVKLGPILGFGSTTIYATANMFEIEIAKREQQATLFLGLIFVKPGGG